MNTTKSGFDRVKELTRESLHVAVRELIVEEGVAAINVKTVAKRAHVSPVSIYNHFGGIRELIFDVAQTVAQEIWEQYEYVLEGQELFMQKLEALLELRIGFIRDGSWKILTAVSKRFGEIGLRSGVDYKRRFSEALRTLIKQGYSEGAIDPLVEEDTVLHYIFSFSDWFNSSDADAFNERRARDLMRLFLYGIGGPVEEKKH